MTVVLVAEGSPLTWAYCETPLDPPAAPEAIIVGGLDGLYRNRVDISAHPVRVPIASSRYFFAIFVLMKKPTPPKTATTASTMSTQAHAGIPPERAVVVKVESADTAWLLAASFDMTR